MVPSRAMTRILCIAGPTASGKSSRAVEEALARGGEVISVDSRQVYRGLDIGTEKVSVEEMRGVPPHLIDIRDVNEPYSAGDFIADASRLIEEIAGRGKLPILVGGTHFYFDALLHGLPDGTPPDQELRRKLEALSTRSSSAESRPPTCAAPPSSTRPTAAGLSALSRLSPPTALSPLALNNMNDTACYSQLP